jgi:enamine deaminase RidA (YjgF/YER057c/UK114 family)
MKIERINPEKLAAPRGYAHAVAVPGNHRTIYIGGQNALDAKGNLVGGASLADQTRQVLRNIDVILESVGTTHDSIVKMTIYLVQGQDPVEGFKAFQEHWPEKSSPPAISVLFVAGLGRPDWLVEIEAIAAIPE